jgi:rhamnulokinase
LGEYVAVDLGASSLRVVLGRLAGGRLEIDELHRVPNAPVELPDGLYTDVLRLWTGVQEGLRAAPERLDGIAVDGWAVDFGLLGPGGELLANPRHYRDERHARGAQVAFARVPREEVYATTGIQFMPINTLDQLVALEGSPLLAAAERLLLIPDLIGYWLTGAARAEETLASTTQLWDPGERRWAGGLIERLGIRRDLLAEPIRPATRLGTYDGTPVWAAAAHDTASAVAAVPADGPDFAFISSGTWSLVGVEAERPVRSEAARAANLTNEVGLDGSIRLLKNVMGLWLVQQCIAHWGGVSHVEASRLAASAPAGGPLIDPDRPEFLAPGDMPARIRAACRESGQPEPEGHAAILRCALDSLACKYRLVLETIERVAGRPAGDVHIVGGGAQDATLCRLTADVLGRPVHAGPVEATAAGNLLVQALGAGALAGREEIRAVVRRSLPPTTYEPSPAADTMEDAYERFLAVAGLAIQETT